MFSLAMTSKICSIYAMKSMTMSRPQQQNVAM